MHHVFISYSRRDIDLVTPIVAALQERGVAVWIDQESIPASMPWQDEINAALHSAALVVCIATPNWRTSQPCQAEYAEADRVGKLVGSIDPRDSEPGEVAEWVAETLRTMRAEYHRSTALLTRARAWVDSGRKGYLLAPSALLRRAGRALAVTGTGAVPEVQEFVAASRRRRAWRTAGGLLIAITAPIALGSLLFVQRFDQALDERLDDNLREISREHAIAQVAQSEPFAALAALEKDVGDDPGIDAEGLRLLSMTAGPWPAPSDDRRPPSVDHTSTSVSGETATIATRGVVEVRSADGALLRVVAAPQAIDVAWSPDGRLLAVADPGRIDILNPSTGRVVVQLPGAFTRPASSVRAVFSAIEWDADGGLRADAGDAGVVSWDLGPLLPPAIAGDPWVIAGAALGDDVAVALRDGRILRVDADGAVQSERASQGDGSVIRLSPTDTRDEVAAITRSPDGADSLVILDASLREVSSFALPDACIPGGSTTTPTRYVVACGNGLMVVVDRAGGAVSEVTGQVSAVAVGSAGEHIYARDQAGPLAVFSDDLRSATIIPSSRCPATTALMAYLPAGDQMLVTGPGAAGMCRSHTFDLAARVPHSMTFPWVSLPRSQALAVSPDGRHGAYGFDDGTVWIVAADDGNAYERQVDRSLGAQVRALAFSSDGKTLRAVSVDGRVVSIPVRDDALADALDRARDILSVAAAQGWQAEEQ